MKPDKSYAAFVESIAAEIGKAKIAVARVVNTQLTKLYWNIGKIILEKQQEKGWGQSVVEKLAIDLQKRFRGYKGFSPRNLWDMRRFYEAYKDHAKLRQLVAEIPWGHNLVLLNKVTQPAESRYYAEMTIQMGWSRNVLLNQIKIKAYNKHKLIPKQHNFKRALPVHLLRQADEMLKSKYNLDFLGVAEPLHERELEAKLIEKLKNFILELGYGFSYIGNQYRLVLKKEYFVDLLFFHRKLRCLVAIDLKMGSFEPEFAGKMNFYLNMLDDKVRMEDENPSIGIILCADKDSVEVDFALKEINKPIAVAEYELKKSVPKKLQKQLPSVQDLQTIIRNEMTRKK